MIFDTAGWIVAGIAVMLPLLIFIDWIGILAYWCKWSSAEIGLLLAAALGMLCGAAVFGWMSENVVKGCIGLIAVLFVRYRKLGLRLSGLPGRVTGLVRGSCRVSPAPLPMPARRRRCCWRTCSIGTGQGSLRGHRSDFLYRAQCGEDRVLRGDGALLLENLKVSLLLAHIAPVGVWVGLKAIY